MSCVIGTRIPCDCTDWPCSDRVPEMSRESGECHGMRGRTAAHNRIGHVRYMVRTVKVFSIPTVWEGESDNHNARVTLCRRRRKGGIRSESASKGNGCTIVPDGAPILR